MKTVNSNKLIAEFMGIRHALLQNAIVIDNEVLKEEDLMYHRSWDWLMPVVQKVYRLGLDNVGALLVRDAVAEDNLNNTHKAVVDFINRHNNNS